jgi:hypothetical protein
MVDDYSPYIFIRNIVVSVYDMISETDNFTRVFNLKVRIDEKNLSTFSFIDQLLFSVHNTSENGVLDVLIFNQINFMLE